MSIFGYLCDRIGEVLYILEEDYSEGWYFAVNARGEEGVVPKSYVKVSLRQLLSFALGNHIAAVDSRKVCRSRV